MQLNIDVSTFKIHLLAVILYFAWYLLFHSIQLPLVLPTQLSSSHPCSAWAWGWKSWIIRAILTLFSEGGISNAAKADPKYHRNSCVLNETQVRGRRQLYSSTKCQISYRKGPWADTQATSCPSSSGLWRAQSVGSIKTAEQRTPWTLLNLVLATKQHQ